jgi:HPt (histidine-containing phosphotransfer) domain-containing protein
VTGDPALDPGGIERLLEITGGDAAFVDELIDTYLQDAAMQLDLLRDASTAGDVGALVRPAHSLKSSSDSVGALALTSLCRELETQARGGSVADPGQRVAAIADAFEAVRRGLLAARGGS